MQACKTLADAISSPQASPKILTRLGFRPQPHSQWSSIFRPRLDDVQAQTLKGYPQHLRRQQLVKRFLCDNVTTETAWSRASETGKVTVRAKFTKGRNGRQLPLPVVGGRLRSMLICQPPIKEMSILANCCRRLYTAETEKEAPKIFNATGLTVGDLYAATMDHAQRHMDCVHAYIRHHDKEDGTVQATITFEGQLQLQPGDPQIPRQKPSELHESMYEAEDRDDLNQTYKLDQNLHYHKDRCGLAQRLTRYVMYKRKAHDNGERIVTMADYLAGYTHDGRTDDEEEKARRNGHYYDRDTPREKEW
ncbi:hypothetical protein LTR17_007857 [Elasticomyces elasticus]|nr:hypothetical protein LTR17_007857 [Elasticomyces elasticus]